MEETKDTFEKFYELFSQSPISIELSDSKGILQNINQHGIDLYGIVDSSEVINKYNLFEDPNVNDNIHERLKNREIVSYEVDYDFNLVKAHNLYRTTKSGVINLSATIAPFILGGKITGYIVATTDITKQKKAEQTLRDSEKRIKNEKKFTEAALNTQRDAFFVFDPANSKAIRWNKAFSEISGYTNQEIAKLNALDSYYSVSDMEKARRAIKRIDREETALIEMDLITKDGKTIPFEYLGTSINDKNGFLKYVVFVGRDITERKETEEALDYERNLIKILLENHPDFIYFKDSKARFQLISKRFSEFFGRNLEDIIGKTDLELFPEEIAIQKHTEDLNIIKTGIPIINKEESDGETWVLTTKLPWVDKIGNIKGLFGISRDITERKYTEESYRSLIENFQGIAFQGYQDFSAAFFRGAVDEITGYREEDFLSGKVKWNELIHLDDLSEINEKIKKFHENNIQKRDKREYRIIDKKGETKWILEFSEKFYDPSAEKEGVRGIIVDNTEKKLIEQKLKESEKKFRSLVETTSDWIWEVDKYGAYTYSSPKIRELLGYEPEEVIGKTPFDLMSSDEAKSIGEKFFNIILSQKSFEGLENRNLHKNGRVVTLETSGTPIFDIEGKLKGYRGIDRDITKRKQAEQRIQESEKKTKDERDNLLNMLNSMEDGVYIINEHFEIEYVNPSLKKEFGPIENKKCYEYFQGISEPCPSCKTQEKTTQGSIRWEWDSPITKKYYELIATPLKRLDGSYSKLVIFHDITKRKKAVSKIKKAREKADMYLKLAGVILVALNRDGVITLLNKKGYEILKYEEGELVGKSWFEFCLPPQNRERVQDYFNKLIRGEIDIVPFYENSVITKNGDEKIITWSTILFKDADGNITGLLSSGEDITESRKAEKELKLLSKLKSELLTRTSHELKTPAMHIKGYADLLLHKYKQNLGIDELQIISHIKKGVLRLETLIYDILHKAELDSGDGELHKVENNLSSIIELSVKELNSFAALRGHSIISDIQNQMITDFDKEQIRHVLNNLITNAIKYTPINGIIGVNSTITDDFITIAVQDNGIGLTEEQINRLFTQFGKIERYGQGFDIITEGSGLGLHIAKKIIDLHGGRIWVESGGKNKGSTFYFSLPKANI
ncbi:MAG: PAS domain S-box protein [Promethearchaeota archaeon]|jgi:PAS domain S-box-containing protein